MSTEMNSVMVALRRIAMTGMSVAVGLGLLGLLASGVAAQRKNRVHVCVGANSVLRFQSGEKCAAGERSFLLAEVEAGAGVPEDGEATQKEIAALKSRIESLTNRVAALETGSSSKNQPGSVGASRVFAPFEVLDKSGSAILRVTDTSIEDEPKRGSRVLLAHGAANNYSLFFRTANGVSTSGIGQTKEGAGGLYVNDVDGTLRAAVLGTDGVVAFNKTGAGVAKLGSLASGNGYLAIANAGGNAMVEAGGSEDRGLVRAYPTTGITPVPVPFFIRGGVWKK